MADAADGRFLMLSKLQAELLETIERDLRRKGVPIPFRPLHAMGRFAHHCGLEISADHPLIEDIQQWYVEHYGDRLRGVTILGRLPILLRGDVHTLILAPHVEKRPKGVIAPCLVWSFESGAELVSLLDPSENAQVRDLLDVGWRCFSELAPLVSERALSTEATLDLDSAIDELTRPQGPRTGLSKWASLQAAEKSLKEFVRHNGGEPPRTHDLEHLNELATLHGLPDFRSYRIPEGNVLELVLSDPGVRYGDVSVSVTEAVGAYYAALIICTAIAAKLRLKTGGRSWLSLTEESPASFVIKRFLDMSGVPYTLPSP